MRQMVILSLCLFIMLLLSPVALATEDVCASILGERSRGECYTELAVETLNLSYCDNAKYHLERWYPYTEECLMAVAVRRGSEEACNMVGSGQRKYLDQGNYLESLNCRMTLAARTEEPTFCIKQDSQEDTEKCYHEFGVYRNATEFCKFAGDYEKHCYYQIAVKTGDEELCRKSGPFRAKCFHGVAVRLVDPQYCEEAADFEACLADVEPRLCGEGEFLLNGTCMKLRCKSYQIIADHRCEDIDCGLHYKIEDHVCVPKFLCSDSDGQNYEKRGTCRAPNTPSLDAKDTDRCWGFNKILGELTCNETGLECKQEIIQCEPYCYDKGHIFGRCYDGHCVCFDDEVVECDYIDGFENRLDCYAREGIGGIPALFRFQGIRFGTLGFLVLITMILSMIICMKPLPRPSKESLRNWLSWGAVDILVLIIFITVSHPPWHVAVALTAVLVGYSVLKLQAGKGFKPLDAWRWFIKLKTETKGVLIGFIIGYFILFWSSLILMIVALLTAIIEMVLSGDASLISQFSSELGTAMKSLGYMISMMFSYRLSAFFGTFTGIMGAGIGFMLGKLKVRWPLVFKRLIVAIVILFIIITYILLLQRSMVMREPIKVVDSRLAATHNLTWRNSRFENYTKHDSPVQIFTGVPFEELFAEKEMVRVRIKLTQDDPDLMWAVINDLNETEMQLIPYSGDEIYCRINAAGLEKLRENPFVLSIHGVNIPSE